MSWSSRNRKQGMFCTVYFTRRKIFKHLRFILTYSVLNTFSYYTYFYISKNIISYTILLVFKTVDSLQCMQGVCVCIQLELCKTMSSSMERNHISLNHFLLIIHVLLLLPTLAELKDVNISYFLMSKFVFQLFIL